MNVETIRENSFKNFHAKGMHYLCLERSELTTIKAYFFEGAAAIAEQVVVPHNHRYDFVTEVLTGELTDYEYAICGNTFGDLGMKSDKAQKWNYLTPLNGGNGFTWSDEVNLIKTNARIKKRGELLLTPCHRIHTIKVKPDTVLLLTQMQDKLGLETPTQAYSFGTKEEKPDTTGLYEKFTNDEIHEYAAKLKALGVAI
jgi:hypothetical protein